MDYKDSSNGTPTIKILVAGPRHSGKGQLGRAWGKTDADLPTLQPVMLYERKVRFQPGSRDQADYRIVTWIVSFDQEFRQLRPTFYSDSEGIVFTFNTHARDDPFLALDDIFDEISMFLGDPVPPSILVGIDFDGRNPPTSRKEKAMAWASMHGMKGTFWTTYTDKPIFEKDTVNALMVLLAHILGMGNEKQGIPGSRKKTEGEW